MPRTPSHPAAAALAALVAAGALAAGCLDSAPAPGTGSVDDPILVTGNPPPIYFGWSSAWGTLIDPTIVSATTWPSSYGPDMRPASAPAVANLDGAGELVYFYRTKANQLAVWDPTRAGFQGAVDTDVITAPSASAHDGVIDVAYVGGSIASPVLYHRRWSPSGWLKVGGLDREIVVTSSDLVAAAPQINATSLVRYLRRVVSYDTELDVFFLRAGGAAGRTYRAGEAAAWTRDLLFWPDAPLLAAPAAASPYPNRVDVVYTTLGGSVAHLSADVSPPSGGAGRWSAIEPVMLGAVGPATISAYTTQYDVFAPLASSAGTIDITQRTHTDSAGWGAAQVVQSCPHPTPASEAVSVAFGQQVTGASVVASSTTRIDLVMFGLDDGFWTNEEGFTVPTGGPQPPCGTCSSVGAACCDGTCLGAGLACDATAHCAACGGAGQACCPGNTCGAGLGCDDDTSTCGCGGRDQPCCTSGAACGAGLTCGAYDHTCGSGFTPTFDVLRSSSCTGACHAHAWDKAAADYPLGARASEREAATAIAAAGLVTPGSPATSELYKRATSWSTVSPLGMASHYPDATRTGMQADLAAWISAGAPPPPARP